MQGPSVPRYGRHEIAARLRAELAAFDSPPNNLALGALVDAYPRAEARFGVTRPVIRELLAHQLPFIIITKGTTIARDIDLLSHEPLVSVSFSLPSVDNEALRTIEPGAADVDTRLRLIHRLHDEGVDVAVNATPWMPGVSDVAALLERVNPDIPVFVTPLRIGEYVASTAFGRRWDQRQINAAFAAEYQRVGRRRGLRWSRPPRIDGAPAELADNLGSEAPTDFEPATIAPEPGPNWVEPEDGGTTWTAR